MCWMHWLIWKWCWISNMILKLSLTMILSSVWGNAVRKEWRIMLGYWAKWRKPKRNLGDNLGCWLKSMCISFTRESCIFTAIMLPKPERISSGRGLFWRNRKREVKVYHQIRNNFSINTMDFPLAICLSMLMRYSTISFYVTLRNMNFRRLRKVCWRLWRGCLQEILKMIFRSCWGLWLWRWKNLRKGGGLHFSRLRFSLFLLRTGCAQFFLMSSWTWQPKYQQKYFSVYPT